MMLYMNKVHAWWQVQKVYGTWLKAGERMVQLGLEAQHHRRWKSCQKAFRVRLCPF